MAQNLLKAGISNSCFTNHSSNFNLISYWDKPFIISSIIFKSFEKKSSYYFVVKDSPYIPVCFPNDCKPFVRVYIYILYILKNFGLGKAKSELDALWKDGWIIEGFHAYNFIKRKIKMVTHSNLDESYYFTKEYKSKLNPSDCLKKDLIFYDYVQAKNYHLDCLIFFKKYKKEVSPYYAVRDKDELFDMENINWDNYLQDCINDYMNAKNNCTLIRSKSENMREWSKYLFEIGVISACIYPPFEVMKSYDKKIQNRIENLNRISEEYSADSYTTLKSGNFNSIQNFLKEEIKNNISDKRTLIKLIKLENYRLRIPPFLCEYFLENIDLLVECNSEVDQFITRLYLQRRPYISAIYQFLESTKVSEGELSLTEKQEENYHVIRQAQLLFDSLIKDFYSQGYSTVYQGVKTTEELMLNFIKQKK